MTQKFSKPHPSLKLYFVSREIQNNTCMTTTSMNLASTKFNSPTARWLCPSYGSLYSLIWDFSCLKLMYGPQQHGLMFGSSYLNHLDMNTCFKVFASYNILQYMCDFIDVLRFVTVSKCWKSPKLTNIVIWRLHTWFETIMFYFQHILTESCKCRILSRCCLEGGGGDQSSHITEPSHIDEPTSRKNRWLGTGEPIEFEK